jgi:hypothetical protein
VQNQISLSAEENNSCLSYKTQKQQFPEHEGCCALLSFPLFVKWYQGGRFPAFVFPTRHLFIHTQQTTEHTLLSKNPAFHDPRASRSNM